MVQLEDTFSQRILIVIFACTAIVMRVIEKDAISINIMSDTANPMINEPVGRATMRSLVLARIFCVIFGIVAIAWALLSFPVFLPWSSIERTAKQIVAGDQFKIETLMEQMLKIEAAKEFPYCYPVARRSTAIIRFRIIEETISVVGAHTNIDTQMMSLNDSILKSISCAPADPFLWLIYSWAENTRNSCKIECLKYLKMSYQLGPNEGWIALIRNHFAFSIYQKLTPDLADQALSEFLGLVEMGVPEQMVQIFTGPAWQVRDKIIPRLKDVSDRGRRQFAKALYAQGFDTPIFGVDRPSARPWNQ